MVTYEAFAPKMLGALRQELIFSRHLREAGRPPGWLGVPLVLTSHTWENAKNEQSHQDPTLAEAWLGEMADVARVCFPADANSAMAMARVMVADYVSAGFTKIHLDCSEGCAGEPAQVGDAIAAARAAVAIRWPTACKLREIEDIISLLMAIPDRYCAITHGRAPAQG